MNERLDGERRLPSRASDERPAGERAARERAPEPARDAHVCGGRHERRRRGVGPVDGLADSCGSIGRDVAFGRLVVGEPRGIATRRRLGPDSDAAPGLRSAIASARSRVRSGPVVGVRSIARARSIVGSGVGVRAPGGAGSDRRVLVERKIVVDRRAPGRAGRPRSAVPSRRRGRSGPRGAGGRPGRRGRAGRPARRDGRRRRGRRRAHRRARVRARRRRPPVRPGARGRRPGAVRECPGAFDRCLAAHDRRAGGRGRGIDGAGRGIDGVGRLRPSGDLDARRGR